jgi:hypothetical protein
MKCTYTLLKERPLTGLYLIFGVCMFGCAQTAFHLGRQDGIESAVEHFINIGVLEVEEENE